MIRAIKQPTPSPLPRQSSDYLSIGQASRQFNLHANTLRFYCDNGLIEFVTTLGNHRRLLKSSLERKLGLVSEDDSGVTKKTAIYARVSSQQQKSEGGLARQKEKLATFVAEKYGEQEPLHFEDTASSFGKRPGLEKLVFAMIEGKVSRICFADLSRLSRVPSTSSLLEAIAEKFGVVLEAVEEEENQEEINLLVSELANYCQILCARMNARKSSKILSFDIPDKGKEIILEEVAKGTSISKIRGMLFEKGITNPRNGKRIGHSKISAFVTASLPERVEEKTGGQSVVERFLQQSFVVLNENAKTPSAVLYSRFQEWCNQNEYAVLGKIHFCMELQRNGLVKFRGHLRSWRGVGLK